MTTRRTHSFRAIFHTIVSFNWSNAKRLAVFKPCGSYTLAWRSWRTSCSSWWTGLVRALHNSTSEKEARARPLSETLFLFSLLSFHKSILQPNCNIKYTKLSINKKKKKPWGKSYYISMVHSWHSHAFAKSKCFLCTIWLPLFVNRSIQTSLHFY